MKRGVVLLSGGMDSLVTLAIALEGWDVFPVHVNYRQRTEGKELESFRKIISFYGLEKFLVADIDYLGKIGGSSLTELSIEPEKGAPVKNQIPNTYVPFRNTHLLAIGVSYAEVMDAEAVFIGAVESDSSNYPDCRKEYIDAFNKLVKTGSKSGRIRIIAPVINMDKKEIVKKGAELRAPFHLSWSCYVDNVIACGECQSCYLRKKAFKEAGIKDPIEYRRSKDGL